MTDAHPDNLTTQEQKLVSKLAKLRQKKRKIAQAERQEKLLRLGALVEQAGLGEMAENELRALLARVLNAS